MWNRRAPSHLQMLAAFWWLRTKMLLVMARRLLASERAGAADAAEIAEQLELFATASAVAITRDITACDAPRTPADQHARDYLCVLANVLTLLAVFALRIRMRLRAGVKYARAKDMGVIKSPAPAAHLAAFERARIFADTS